MESISYLPSYRQGAVLAGVSAGKGYSASLTKLSQLSCFNIFLKIKITCT